MPRRVNVNPMAGKERRVRVIKGRKVIKEAKHDDSPLRSIFCLKNWAKVKEVEEKEDCFILEFDPYDSLDYDFKLSISEHVEDTDTTDLYVIGEKGKVACRDYPHSRYTCAKYPFDKTDHETHCELVIAIAMFVTLLLLVTSGLELQGIAMLSKATLGIKRDTY
ncbi:unnamed protein product [Fraxinus pennsylvanica]|uniref:Uncharacterized protein n=1 Tax=Fraxinus pennsylvanica TaxID=56036 RepID=A0AAD2AK06_9LAMI|nr:unnamed protein product [Fraxinus pennsylvanica]